MVETYKKGGKIAVLVSGGFGAGWSTWNCNELAYDKRVVEFWLSKKDDKKFMREIDSFCDNHTKDETSALFASWGYDGTYFGGFEDIEIKWVAEGQPFRIMEYDGNEYMEIYDDSLYTVL